MDAERERQQEDVEGQQAQHDHLKNPHRSLQARVYERRQTLDRPVMQLTCDPNPLLLRPGDGPVQQDGAIGLRLTQQLRGDE
jgi:hypothetical protein